MRVLRSKKVWGYGLLSWLVPFLAAFVFYGPDGLWIEKDLFKSIMVVLSATVGVVLALKILSDLGKDKSREMVWVALIWLCMNWAMDAVFLVGGFGMTLPAYIMEIGVRYIVIVPILWAIGKAGE